jgi:hypothetical protein
METNRADAIEFTTRDNVEVAQAAASAYFWRMLRTRRLWWLVSCAIFFSLTMALLLYYGGPGWAVGIFLFLLAMTLAYVPVFYFAHRKAATTLVLRSSKRRVRITTSDMTITSELGSITLPWTQFCSVWEYPDFIIFVIGQFSYLWLPRQAVPANAMTIVQTYIAKS